MKIFPRKTNTKHAGSYLHKRRHKRLLIGAVVLLCLASALLAASRLRTSAWFVALRSSKPVAKSKVLSAWEQRRWDEVRALTQASLMSAPLDPFYLAFGGFADFYKAAELPDGDDRSALLDESIFTLRKVLAVGSRSLPRAEVLYVLGKAAYHKGRYYYDESAEYLEAAVKAGYKGGDSMEYLALAYSGLGETEKAIAAFETALAKNRAPLLLLAAAKCYADASNPQKAEALLVECLASGDDALTREKARFLLGAILHERGDSAGAESQYDQILAANPQSAEAHYRIGLLYQERGDPLKARSEWRKAVSLDPMHAAARQKLSEKT